MLRSAVTVVRRSSCILIGTSTTVARRRGVGDGSLRRGAVETVHVDRQTDDDDLDLLLAYDAGDLGVDVLTRPLPSNTVSGDAIVPERSLRARPNRFEPGSIPSARTPLRRTTPASAVTLAASVALRIASSRPGRILAAGGGMSPLPPPPPETALAGPLMRSAASIPSEGCTAATRLAPPVGVAPINTTRRTPGCWRRRSPSRGDRRGRARRPGARSLVVGGGGDSAACPSACRARTRSSRPGVT